MRIHICSWRGATIAGIGMGVLLGWPRPAVLAGTVEPEPYPNRERLGINLTGLSALSSQWSFADIFKSSTGWTERIGDYSIIDHRAHLEPGAALATWVSHGNPYMPKGVYTAVWEGNADLIFAADWQVIDRTATETGGMARLQPSAMNFDLRDWSHGFYLRASNPGDSGEPRWVDNIRVYAPGYGPGEAGYGQTFMQPFTQPLAPFGTIRFMDFMNANHSDVIQWDQRAKVDHPRYNMAGGVPVEHMVELSNLARANPWFAIPYQADDDYIRQFAAYVRDNLDPDLKIYVEYGNEVWARFTPAHDYLLSRVPPEEPPWMWYKQWAERSRNTFRLWQEVFGEDAGRIVRVAAGQAANRWASPRYYEALEGEFDVIAITAYIGGGRTFGENSTVEDVIQALREDIAGSLDRTIRTDTDVTGDPNQAGYILGTDQPKGAWAYHKQLAEYFSEQYDRHIPLIAYEAGQGMVPGSTASPWYNLFVEAQRDPRMAEVYLELLHAWFDELGGELFAHFSYTRAIDQGGAWGALEYQDQPHEEAPKYQALRDYSVMPLLMGDANRDGRVDGEDFLIWQANFGTPDGATWSKGDFNGDGQVDGEDFLIWQAHFGVQASAAAATPEPAGLGPLLVLLAVISRRRRTPQRRRRPRG